MYHHYFSEVDLSPDTLQHALPLVSMCSDSALDVMTELSLFRGSELSLLMYFIPTEKIRRYNLFFLLRWAEMEIVERDEFIKRVPAVHRQSLKEEERGVLGYVIVSGLREHCRKVSLAGGKLAEQITALEEDRLPGKVYGLVPVIKTDKKEAKPLNIALIEKTVMKTGIFCRYMSMSAYHSRSYYELGDYASLIPYKNGSLALGYDALIADCAVSESMGKGTDIPILKGWCR